MPKTMTIIRDVAMHREFGGFRLTTLGARELAKRKNLPFVDLSETMGQDHYAFGDKYETLDEVCQRDDPALISVIRDLGPLASVGGRVEVVKVEISIDISDYDGRESPHVYGGVKWP